MFPVPVLPRAWAHAPDHLAGRGRYRAAHQNRGSLGGGIFADGRCLAPLGHSDNGYNLLPHAGIVRRVPYPLRHASLYIRGLVPCFQPGLVKGFIAVNARDHLVHTSAIRAGKHALHHGGTVVDGISQGGKSHVFLPSEVIEPQHGIALGGRIGGAFLDGCFVLIPLRCNRSAILLFCCFVHILGLVRKGLKYSLPRRFRRYSQVAEYRKGGRTCLLCVPCAALWRCRERKG